MWTFIERAALVADMPQSDALLPRLEMFATYLKEARSALDFGPLKGLVKRLRTQP
jgi:hypothetical protein